MADNSIHNILIIFLVAFLLFLGSAFSQDDNFNIEYDCADECRGNDLFGNPGQGVCIDCIVAGWECQPGCLPWVYGPSLCNCIPERYYPRPDAAAASQQP